MGERPGGAGASDLAMVGDRIKGVAFFRSWPIALRLAVLVQPSSAFVERAFSQIKLILKQTGVSSLEENIEARVLVRCNSGVL